MKKLPNFLIIGAQKAGTTTLHNALSQHPEVYMLKNNELNIYIKEELFYKGIESIKQCLTLPMKLRSVRLHLIICIILWCQKKFLNLI